MKDPVNNSTTSAPPRGLISIRSWLAAYSRPLGIAGTPSPGLFALSNSAHLDWGRRPSIVSTYLPLVVLFFTRPLRAR